MFDPVRLTATIIFLATMIATLIVAFTVCFCFFWPNTQPKLILY